MNLLSPFSYLAKKILYLWIRTELIRDSGEQIRDTDETIYVYVVPGRAWSDLLVLECESEKLHMVAPRLRIHHADLKRWHHVYSTAQSRPLKAWLEQKEKRSPLLIGMEAALRKNAGLDIRFVPVLVYWGRPVLKQKHWLRVLFADTWGFAGRSRRFFTILFNGRNTIIEYSPSISLRELISESGNITVVDKAQHRLETRLTEMKTANLGPDISHRRTLISDLLQNDTVRAAIERHQKEQGVREQKAIRTAQRYLEEIVADRSYITIQILQRILSAFWNRFYGGIRVNFSSGLKSLALTHDLVYVPCHRSHIDYLLLSYVIHFEGLAIPYIAAGKNLNMPLIGPVLRKGGAFFIRRSFKGNPLYSTVMFEYLATQIASGMPIEYFIEGGRSRTGRLLQPRPGMLAMTIRAFLKYQKKPVAFIPVYIGYEKMIESKSYLAELKGDDKKSESLFSSVRSILGLRGHYGRVTTNFGAPVFLDDVLTASNPDWQSYHYSDDERPDWLRSSVKQTATGIMQNLNASADVNAINLVATILLASPNQTMDEHELVRSLGFYRRLIKALEYAGRVTVNDDNELEQIRYAEKLGMADRRKHELGDFIYLQRHTAVMMTYYRNNTLHLFALPSLIACCFINVAAMSKDRIARLIRIVYPFLKKEFFLPWHLSHIDAAVDKMLHCIAEHELLELSEGSDIYSRPSISTQHHAQLTTLSRIISPVLELYYMIFALLAEHGTGTLSRERLEELCHLMAQRLSLMYEINSPDFFDKRLISNFIDTLIRLDYVSQEDDRLCITQYAISEGGHARRLLDKNMQYNILQMIQSRTGEL